MRRNLVVVRAGNNSLHRKWLENNSNPRNWDLIVSWFGEADYVPIADEACLRVTGGKWDGLAETFRQLPSTLDKYDYVWLPDDDIDTDCHTINLIFHNMVKFNVRVGQPALTWNSYASHLHTYCVPGLQVRYVNMVESMVPCFTAEHLRTCLPLFGASMTGWGLDLIWCRNGAENLYQSSIFDTITVRHTRPVGLVLKNVSLQLGRDPKREKHALLSSFGLKAKGARMVSYAAKVSACEVTLGWLQTQTYVALLYLFVMPFLRHSGRKKWHLKRLLKSFRFGMPDLTPLDRPSSLLRHHHEQTSASV